jgi:hypothetical protein
MSCLAGGPSSAILEKSGLAEKISKKSAQAFVSTPARVAVKLSKNEPQCSVE